MAVSLVQNAFFLFLTMAVMVSGSHGWTMSTTTTSTLPISSGTAAAIRRPSSALRYQNGDEVTSQYLTQPTTTITSTTSYDETSDDYDYVDDLHDFDPRLRAALRAARNADRLYGLCTPESVAAWAAVDTMFGLSPAGKEVEDCVRKALGDEKSIWSDFEVRA